MYTTVNLYSEKEGEIESFLKLFFGENIKLDNQLFWQKKYQNPINMIDLISAYADNSDRFKIGLWISLDENVFININEYTIDSIIKYLFERYPY